VPLGGADDEADPGHEALASGRAGAWSEARGARLLDAPRAVRFGTAPPGSGAGRLGIGVSVWAAGGAVMAAAAIALSSGSSPTRVANAPRTTAASPKAPSSTRIGTAQSHPELTSRTNRRSTTRRSRSHTQPGHRIRRATTHHGRIVPANQSSVEAASYTIGARTTAATHSESSTSPPYTPPTPAPAPERTSAPHGTNASAAESSSTNRPAFGENGLLGPGHSPDG
jgi:hypothetical protein